LIIIIIFLNSFKFFLDNDNQSLGEVRLESGKRRLDILI